MADNRRYSQPGLEVAPATYPMTEKYFVPAPHQELTVPVPAPLPAKYEAPSPTYAADKEGLRLAKLEHGSRRKLYILIGALIALAIILGATVGGVLGSKALDRNSKSAAADADSVTGPSSNNNDSNSTSPVVNTTAVRPLTRLSVTGRRLTGNGFTSRLFWQGSDNLLRTSRYTSSAGGSWSSPLVFTDLTDAAPGTPIAATQYLVFPQFEVFYLDSSSTFRGINFGEDETAPNPDSIETERPAFTVHEKSRMSAYWPYVIFQGNDLTFRREVFDSRGAGWFNDTLNGWFNPDVVPLGDDGTGLAVIPVVKAFNDPYAAGIAYRDQDGRLSVFSFGGDDTGVAWHSGVPSVTIPAGTAIAALSVGRPNSNTTNSWILYQDASNKIQAVWQGDDNEWKGPQEVGEADAGTDIACLTEQVGDEPSLVLLSEQSDMRRCYYQYQGVIQEKRLTSTTWVDGDTIPME
ncbi:uncharacterized protein F4822DRAFT_219364 [Hypoxylon trugodes]|uniref:uncharacterized protein n=1 Tax=Hypoxylon trugodes TaxID=326681 RepID=UPI00219DFDE7|nr:uncharacterized protein F4822DRAFT_219364 [Hypoxylon trugodes]KAI1389958.1 hypothetical protein F4822DRAFT_219364 [Hypoxylon trugodes]